jgi:hypothetical protein
VLLHSFEDDFTSVWGNVESANIKIGREVGQLPLNSRFQVDEPEILVLNFASQKHERPSPFLEREVSSSPSQLQGGQGMGCSVDVDGLDRKCGSDVGSRVNNETAVERPSGVDCIIRDK